MTAGRLDLTIECGANFRRTFALSSSGDPVSLTGCTARSQIRTAPGQPVLVEPTCTIEDDVIALVIPPAATEAVDITRARWDLEITVPVGNAHFEVGVHRLLEGSVTFSPNITREN